MIERGECGAGDGVVLVVMLKRRTTQGEGRERTCARVGHDRKGSKRRPFALRKNIGV